ncbi:hypothetical protein L7F22_026352, partial [Adiantum nelumboides]|nr:hypothetical protein [Adiantum nelumboides]
MASSGPKMTECSNTRDGVRSKYRTTISAKASRKIALALTLRQGSSRRIVKRKSAVLRQEIIASSKLLRQAIIKSTPAMLLQQAIIKNAEHCYHAICAKCRSTTTTEFNSATTIAERFYSAKCRGTTVVECNTATTTADYDIATPV